MRIGFARSSPRFKCSQHTTPFSIKRAALPTCSRKSGRSHKVSPNYTSPVMRQSSKQILRQRRKCLQARPVTPVGWLLLAAFVLGVVAWFVYSPSHIVPTISVVGALWLWCHIARIIQSRRFDRTARARVGESICQFAQHFRGPDFDPVVVRAVYESTQEQYGRTDLPIRPWDRFSEEYGLLGEDIDDLAGDVATLAFRTLEDTDRNPLYGQVETVADLVLFLQFQPRLPA